MRANPAGAWRLRAEVAAWRWGWAAPSALGLALFIAGMHWAIESPARTDAESAQEQLRRLDAPALRATGPTRADELRQVAALREALARSPDPAESVRHMAALAQAEQIALPQAEYQSQLHATAQLTQVRIFQSVRASYPQLRRYVESVLGDIPNSSLDQVSVRRENVAQAQLEVRLHWSLWLDASAMNTRSDARKKAQ